MGLPLAACLPEGRDLIVAAVATTQGFAHRPIRRAEEGPMDATEIAAPPAPYRDGHNRLVGSRPGTPCRDRAARAFVLACCTLFWAPPAWTQESPATPPRPLALSEPVPQGSVVRLLGRDVKGAGGEVVAQIANVLVDASGRPIAAILDYGGFLGVGKRRIAVAWRALSFAPGEGPGGIILGLDRNQLTNFPEYKPDQPVLAAAPPDDQAPPPPDQSPKAPE
jgi:hypothetical protein